MNEVVITGIGTINPIANNTDEFKKSLEEMRVGIGSIKDFDTEDHKVKIAGEIETELEEIIDLGRASKRYDRVLKLALIAGKEAIEDSGLDRNGNWKESAAVTVSSGIGGFKTLFAESKKYMENGPKTVSPFLIPMMIPDMVSGIIAIHHGLKGPNFSLISACASSLHAIAISSLMIRHGYVDVAVTGGAEASINELAIAAFANMRALSTKNDSPGNASRPFDKERDGFVMSEGAGVLVLESEKHARERNGNIYGYIKGFGMSGDAYHISATEPTGEGAGVCIENCLKDAQTEPEEVDLINCHATGTPTGDKSELLAIKKAFGEHSGKPYVQSTKALIGHSLGAAGAIELIASILESKYSFIHGMPSLIEKDENLEGINISTETINKEVRNVLKNSFGFGGHNVSILYCSQ